MHKPPYNTHDCTIGVCALAMVPMLGYPTIMSIGILFYMLYLSLQIYLVQQYGKLEDTIHMGD